MDSNNLIQYLIENLMQSSYPEGGPRSSAVPFGTGEADAIQLMARMQSQHPNEAYRLRGFPHGGSPTTVGRAMPKVPGNPAMESEMGVELLKAIMSMLMGGKVRTGRWQSKRNH